MSGDNATGQSSHQMVAANSAVHPNVHSAFQQWSEEQTLHVASPYSNSFRWDTRRELYHNFRHHMETSKNVAFHAAEIAYGDRPFEVTTPYDTLQLSSSEELWHKENLINLTVQRFPSDWKYGAYIDGDVQFSRNDWALEAIHLLQHYDFVQLFSSFTDLDARQMPIQSMSSFAFWYSLGIDQTKAFTSRYEDMFLKESTVKRCPGGTGLAWAWRRDAFDKIGGLLDICILGSGDWHESWGLIGRGLDQHPDMKFGDPGYRNAILRHQNRAFNAIHGNVGYLDNHLLHFWHGSRSSRGYGSRWKILRDYKFNPDTDIYRDSQGLWQLTKTKPEMRQAIRRYFLSRNEDRS